MRLHRLYLPKEINNDSKIIIDSKDQAHQICQVFRLKSGDSVVVFDGSGFDFICDIEKVDKNLLELTIKEKVESRFIPKRNVTLCVSIIKRDKFEWIVEKATELGVGKIIPIIGERSEKKDLNIERLNRIAIEASEQSGRGDVPVIGNISNIKDTCENISNNGKTGNSNFIVLHTDSESTSKGTLLGTQLKTNNPSSASRSQDLNSQQPITIFIGPEGGWSPNELQYFKENKIPTLCLGKQILKTETAAVAILSRLLLGV